MFFSSNLLCWKLVLGVVLISVVLDGRWIWVILVCCLVECLCVFFSGL